MGPWRSVRVRSRVPVAAASSRGERRRLLQREPRSMPPVDKLRVASKTDECKVEEACQADGGMYEVIGGTCSYATTDARADDGSAPDGR